MQSNFVGFELNENQQPKTQTSSPVIWASQRLNFIADPQQAEVLDSSHRRVLVNCCRQWGKSTTAAVRALHHALHNPNSETILIAPGLRQSAELLRKITNLSPEPIAKSDGTNRHSLQFANGARILALPANRDKIRGFSNVSLLIIDEAAWVPTSLYFAVRPFLAAAPNASLLVMSTPNGDGGFFHQTWMSNQPWHRIFHVPKLDLIETLVQSIESRRLTVMRNLKDKETLIAQLKSLRYANSRQTGQTTIQVDTNADNPQIANADLVMALAMATWRMKTLYPNPTPTPHQRLPGF